MKARILIVTLLFIAVMVSCKKKEEDEDPSVPKTPLVFASLTASDSLIHVTDVLTLTAVASGDELTYTWTPEYGNILGSGSAVQWTVCHSDIFTITCEVQDKYGEKSSRSIDINVKP